MEQKCSELNKISTSLKTKAKKDPELPKFEWKLFEEKKLGCGTFGSVYLAKYKGKTRKVVAKNSNVESIDSKSCFVKEASLLNSTKGHRNIIRFPEFSIMMEYSCFDFRPFGVEKSLYTLEDFVHFVDEFDFASFTNFMPTAAKDVVEVLKYLHGKNIVIIQ
ncbi:tyrosine kinase [Paramuricea clavata]|uniref:Tyrosine kinase n=1 Tax=Paramuricea clavata TaxID=317549 RepID=A0A7D9IH23_PARCT|nr:tyrosine kinase [Paramuricea clavata]